MNSTRTPSRTWGRWSLETDRRDLFGRPCEPALVILDPRYPAEDEVVGLLVPLDRLGESHWVATARAKSWATAEDVAQLQVALTDLRAERAAGATP